MPAVAETSPGIRGTTTTPRAADLQFVPGRPGTGEH